MTYVTTNVINVRKCIRQERGHNPKYDSCSSFTLRGHTPGSSCKVTVSYNEPDTGRLLRASVQIAIFASLEVVYPETERSKEALILLPVGSATKAVFRGGPGPWVGKPSGHFNRRKSNVVDVRTINALTSFTSS